MLASQARTGSHDSELDRLILTRHPLPDEWLMSDGPFAPNGRRPAGAHDGHGQGRDEGRQVVDHQVRPVVVVDRRHTVVELPGT